LTAIQGKDRYTKTQEMRERLERERQEQATKSAPKKRGRKPKKSKEEAVKTVSE
jgi:hypothetical protein